MKITEVKPNVFAVIRPDFESNVGLIHTSDGYVVIDTTTGEEAMQAVLDAAGISAMDVCQLIITHADGDHVGGNGLFSCPILASQQTYDSMAADQKPGLPAETFIDKHAMQVGGVDFELTFVGGHKPDISVVWLPQHKVLFPADQVFVGCYPFLVNSHVPAWIEFLQYQLPAYGAEVIVSGHGGLAGPEDIAKQLEYMQSMWERTLEHVSQGHSLGETRADEGYIRHTDWARSQLHEDNIEIMYAQAMK
jgi:cyclase